MVLILNNLCKICSFQNTAGKIAVASSNSHFIMFPLILRHFNLDATIEESERID